jgi:hypothetical protein
MFIARRDSANFTKPSVARFGGKLPVSVQRVGRLLILVKFTAASGPSSGMVVRAERLAIPLPTVPGSGVDVAGLTRI